jgi:hypothetical protein
MKIRPVGAELFHVDGQTDRHEEANSRVSQFLRMRLESTKVREVSRLEILCFLSLQAYVTAQA